MSARGDIWYPSLPDRTCPVCEIPVKYEAGYYDSKPLYRCQECGYVIKPASEAKIIAMLCLATVAFALIAFFVGQVVTGISPPAGPQSPPSFFAPKPNTAGSSYSAQ